MRTRRTTTAAGIAGAALLLLCAAAANAGTILIDFNDNSTAGSGWNTFHTGNDNGTYALDWDDGTASGISLALPNVFDSANAGWNNPLPSWAPTSVANDYSYWNAATVQFVLSGLDTNSTYSIDIIVSRNLDRDQDFTITHGGSDVTYDNWNSQTDGWQDGSILTFSNLTPDAVDEITMEIRRDGVSGSINAMRITSFVPEPSTLALLLLGIATVATSERRRNLAG